MKKNMSARGGSAFGGKKLFIISFLGFGLLLASPALATDFYVDFDNGTNAGGNTCLDSSNPCKTFANPSPSAGDTVNVTGTYDSSIGTDLTIAWNGTEGSPITIQAWEGQSQPVFDGSSGFTSYAVIIIGDYLIFDGFKIYAPESNNKIALAVNNSHDTVIQNCDIYGVKNNIANTFGIYEWGSSNGIEYYGNNIYNTAINWVSGDDELIFSGNRIFDIADNGQIGLWLLSCDSAQIYNNIFAGFDGNYYALRLYSSPDGQVINNTFYNNGISLHAMGTDAGTDNVVKNNIFYYSADYQYALFDSTGGVGNYGDGQAHFFDNLDSNNNLFSMGDYGYIASYDRNGSFALYSTLSDWQAAFPEDASSQEANPQLNSIDLNDDAFHLTDSSPAIDAGTDTSAVTDDIDGEARPYNVQDIGADERPVLAVSPNAVSFSPRAKKGSLSWLMDSTYPVTGYTIRWGTKRNLTDATATQDDASGSASITGLKSAKIYYTCVQADYQTDYDNYFSECSNTKKVGTKPVQVKKFKRVPTIADLVQFRSKKQKRVTRYLVMVMNDSKSKVKTQRVNVKKKYLNNSKKKYVKATIEGLESGRTYQIKVRGKKYVSGEWLAGKWSRIRKITIN